MEIAGEGFVLRPWRRGDERDLVRHAGSRNVWRNLTDRFPHPYTPADATAWIDIVERQGEPPRSFAIVVGDEAVGGIGFEPLTDVHSRTAEVGYWLGERHWGKGLATRSLLLLSEYALEAFALARLQAEVFEWNPASGRVLEKAGFVLEARLHHSVVKDGELIDVLLYARLRDGSVPSGKPGAGD